MAAPTAGILAPWIDKDDVKACCSGLSSNPNEVQLTRAVWYASTVLFRLSGRQYPGVSERTVRPCYAGNGGCGYEWTQWPMGGWSFWVWDQAAAGWSFPSLPYRVDGQWFDSPAGGCGGRCWLPSVALPAPVVSVGQVVIDGVVLDPSAYKVQQYKHLVRVDGNRWPCSNDLTRESGVYPGVNDGSRAGTWQVTYDYGRLPDEAGLAACARYACELAKFFCNAADCQLPQRVKHVSREGIELDFVDPMQFIDDGKTGIYEVDMWLRSVNPAGIMRRATVSRMDQPARSRGFTWEA